MKTGRTIILYLSDDDHSRFCFLNTAIQNDLTVVAVDNIDDAIEAANTYQFDFAVLDCSAIFEAEAAALETTLDRNFVQTVYYTKNTNGINDRTDKPVLDKNSVDALDLIQQISGEKPSAIFFIAALRVLGARAHAHADDTHVAIEQLKRRSILRFIRRKVNDQ